MLLHKILSISAKPFIFLCGVLLALAGPVVLAANQLDALYEVVLPVSDESNTVRNAAMADGLAEVLVRMSGDSLILQKLTPPSAAAYVKQYRYEALDPAASTVADTEKQIRLQYNGTRIMNYLRNNGLPIWGEQRPLGVVWLAIRDGSNQYLLRASDSSPLKTKAESLFKQRGIPVIWPAYDNKDRAKLTFTDVWAGFSEPLLDASVRYTNGPVLAGNMAWNGSEWRSDWTLLDQRYSQRWSVQGTDYDAVLFEGINQLSDGMGQHYAVLESTDSSADANLVLDIENVNSLAGFVRLKKYLASLQAVQSVQISRLGADNAVFHLSLRSRVEDFINLLASSSRLKPVKKPAVITPAVATTSPDPGAASDPAPDAAAPDAAPAPMLMVQNLYHYRLVN